MTGDRGDAGGLLLTAPPGGSAVRRALEGIGLAGDRPRSGFAARAIEPAHRALRRRLLACRSRRLDELRG